MKILQVVTLASPDASYGGPFRVALNQVRELRARGHDVTLIAGALGYDTLPTQIDGVAVSLFPARQVIPHVGFAGIASRAMRTWLRRAVVDFDVVHVHFARDLIALPAARIAGRAGVPLVVQPHGMVDQSARATAHLIDAVATRRALRDASRVCYLTDVERASLEAVARRQLKFTRVINGVPIQSVVAREGSTAQVRAVFMGRLAARKRPELFASAIVSVAGAGLDIHGLIVGPDEGMGARVDELVRAHPETLSRGQAVGFDQTTDVLAASDIFVLPSRAEPFPMAALEALSVGVPVVVAADCGIAASVTSAGAGIVFDGTLESLVEAITTLATEPERRQAMSQAAGRLARAEYGMGTVAATLEQIYSAVKATL